MSQDGTIEGAINSVISDHKYRYELQGYAPNSIKVLDLAKKHIGAQITSAQGTPMNPGNRNDVRLYTDAKNRLVSAIDEFSPTYAEARAIHSEGAKPLQAIRESGIGKIASMDDAQLKAVPK